MPCVISLYGLPFSLLPLRFWRKVHFAPNECWLWTATKIGPDGHKAGAIRWHGKTRYAHRIIYEAFVSPIPNHLEIDHLCRNRLCVNPKHLEAVTHQVNVQRGMLPVIWWLRQTSKTHCPQGHPYKGSNYINLLYM